MEKVQKVRDLERNAKESVKNVNCLIEIRQTISSKSEAKDARIAALHALRRLTLHYVESGWYHKGNAGNDKAVAKKVKEYNSWFQAQYASFKDCLLDLIATDKDAYHAVAVRTYVEIMKVETLVEKGPDASPQFPVETFKALLYALVVSKNEIDVDLLLMIKEEILSMNDCTYAALVALRDMIAEVKDLHHQAATASISTSTTGSVEDPIVANFDTIRKNFIDLLRVIEIPEEIEAEDFLIPLVPPSANGGHNAESEGSDNEGGDSSDEEREAAAREEAQQAALQRMDPLLAELAGLKGKKRPNGDSRGGGNSKRQRPALSLYERLNDVVHYKRAFSKAWLALLSLPFTAAQHKILLKHLPEHVVPRMRNPLLLADYLTTSYKTGGMVAVLALESLFHLIVHHNLDYPDFFLSLYNLCTVEVFSAKYRAKFVALLSASLKSVNLPAYLVASFAKRLAHLALHTPTPNSQYCIAQCTWLLRQHPQAQVLIHRKATTTAGEPKNTVEFDNNECENLEKTHALQSSLWEMELLQQHHLVGAAQLATSLATPESTMITAAAGDAYVHIEDYLNLGSAELLEAALLGGGGKKDKEGNVVVSGKREAALAYVKPTSLFPAGGLLSECFGTVTV